LFKKSLIIILALSAFFISSVSMAQYDASSAVSLSVNGSSSGAMDDTHGEYWWKVTLPADGVLYVTTTSTTTEHEIDLYMYDGDGTTNIAGYDIGAGVLEQTHRNDLKQGTYYIRAYRWKGVGSYTISSQFTASHLSNDSESNDTPESAIILAPGQSKTGHLGYYSLGVTEAVDWYAVTVTSDGSLTVASESDSTLEMDLYMFDQDKVTNIAGYSIGSGIYEKTRYVNLTPGTYYIRANRWTGYGSYTISAVEQPTSLANDLENNDTAESAVSLFPGQSKTGHLGFYGNKVTETVDWYSVTVPSDGHLIVSTVSDSTLEMDLYLFDQDKVTNIAGYSIGAGIYEKTQYVNLTAGTYYVRANHWTGYGSYTISAVFNPAKLANDAENNDVPEAAVSLANGQSKTGHLGFYGNKFTDTIDWYSVTVPSDGSLSVSTVSDSTLEMDLYMFDQDKAVNIAGYSIGAGINERTQFVNLTPGTYYVRANHWTGYGNYTITSHFIPAKYTNDSEMNDTIATAASAPIAATRTGHLGFYNKGANDPRDFYVFTVTTAMDSLFVRTLSDSTLEADIYIYNSSEANIGVGGSYGVNEIAGITGVKPGTYYFQISRWTGYGSYSFIISGSSATMPVVQNPGSFAGTVKDSKSGSIIQGAVISVVPGNFSVVSDGSGAFALTGLAPGDYTVTATYPDYEINTLQISVSQDALTSADLVMVPVVLAVEGTPHIFRVNPAYPNPFNPTTTIEYEIPKSCRVSLVVYDVLGRQIRVLNNDSMSPGIHHSVWDGRDDRGNITGSGVYIYKLQAGSNVSVGKMTFVR
jgi:hypothetical protein